MPKKPRIAILTGAGISAESGIDTFRSQGGLWENHRIEDVASPEGFARNPELVIDFYNQRRLQLRNPKITPNPAHFHLAKLEEEYNVAIITQNVDNLHERAGSSQVIHMHGELDRMKCSTTSQSFVAPTEMNLKENCSCCETSTLRPDIVWFGEIPYHMEAIEKHLLGCDMFVAIGTSGHVYPAAGFVSLVGSKPTVEINSDDTAISEAFQHHFRGPASTTVPEWILDIPKILNKIR